MCVVSSFFQRIQHSKLISLTFSSQIAWEISRALPVIKHGKSFEGLHACVWNGRIRLREQLYSKLTKCELISKPTKFQINHKSLSIKYLLNSSSLVLPSPFGKLFSKFDHAYIKISLALSYAYLIEPLLCNISIASVNSFSSVVLKLRISINLCFYSFEIRLFEGSHELITMSVRFPSWMSSPTIPLSFT